MMKCLLLTQLMMVVRIRLLFSFTSAFSVDIASLYSYSMRRRTAFGVRRRRCSLYSDSAIFAAESTTSTSSQSSSQSSVADEEEQEDDAFWKKELSKADLQGILDTAERAARAAGEIITSHTGCCSDETTECEIKYSIKDVVTQYDKEAQTAIESIIRQQYPKHSFLGEEDVAAGAAASEAALLEALQRQRKNAAASANSDKDDDEDDNSSSHFMWICDPIDGTANFAAGLALSAVTMGVVYKGVPVVGVVYDPHRNEMFSAVKGQGAYLSTTTNGNNNNNTSEKQQRLLQTAPAVTDVKDAIINAGCPADPNAFECSMRGVLALNGKSRGLRIIACSALTTAWIASGRLGAHFGYDLSSWDLVAGALLIQEAGGIVTDLDGTPYKLETRNMLCSNNRLVHDQILDILTKADAVSFTRSEA